MSRKGFNGFKYDPVVEGQRVRMTKDIMRWPWSHKTGYGDPVVYIPKGSMGTVKGNLTGDIYHIVIDGHDCTTALNHCGFEVIEDELEVTNSTSG